MYTYVQIATIVDLLTTNNVAFRHTWGDKLELRRRVENFFTPQLSLPPIVNYHGFPSYYSIHCSWFVHALDSYTTHLLTTKTGTTVVFSIIVLGMGAHMTSLTNEFFHGYFTFAALAIATAVLTITSVPVMLALKNASNRIKPD
jgi:hypothetical protein